MASEMIAYDSARPHLIPDFAGAVLMYADGDFRWPSAQVARFRHARHRYITVVGNARVANICDVEKLDVPPEHSARFVEARRALFPADLPVIYCNRSTLPKVQSECRGMDFGIWLATLDGSRPRTITGPGELLAVQFQGGIDADFDMSVIYNPDWLRPGRP